MERIFSAKTLAEGEKIAKSGHVIECRVNNYYYTVINALV